jgi:hypothetical protein
LAPSNLISIVFNQISEHRDARLHFHIGAIYFAQTILDILCSPLIEITAEVSASVLNAGIEVSEYCINVRDIACISVVSAAIHGHGF